MISDCTHKEQPEALSPLYNMAVVDGSVNEREVRLLLYSIKAASLEFNGVVEYAKKQAT